MTATLEKQLESYWVGTLHGCPIHDLTVHLGTIAICLPRRTYEIVTRNGIQQRGADRPGDVLELTPEQGKALKAWIEERVYRWNGEPREPSDGELPLPGQRGQIWSKKDPRYRASDKDRALSEVVFVKRVESRDAIPGFSRPDPVAGVDLGVEKPRTK